jgi:hypothetical protein
MGPKSGIPPLAAARMQRWALLLASYSYHFLFQRTTEHVNADPLSRFPIHSKRRRSAELAAEEVYHVEFFSTIVSEVEVKKEKQMYAELTAVKDQLCFGWKTSDPATSLATYYRKRLELSLEDGVLVWGRRVVIPKSLRSRILAILHDGHQGIVRMKLRARSYVWWPGIDEQLELLASECSQCLVTRNFPAVLKDSKWLTPDASWEMLHTDFDGPVDPGRKMLLVLADASTKWPEIFVMDTTTSGRTIEALQTLFANFGIPKTLVSDNGAQFTSKEFQNFMASNGVHH